LYTVDVEADIKEFTSLNFPQKFDFGASCDRQLMDMMQCTVYSSVLVSTYLICITNCYTIS